MSEGTKTTYKNKKYFNFYVFGKKMLKRQIYYKIELNIININNYIKRFTYTQLN